MKKKLISYTKYISHSVFLIALVCTVHIAGFSTLTDIQKYASSTPENVPSANQNWINPRYNSFYQNNLPSLVSNILHFFGIKKTIWRVQSFQKIVQEVTELRTIQKLNGNLVAHRYCQPQDKFLIWGDLFGAFHSLVRDLTWLEQQKIIDDSLTIIKDQYYLVFNGNLISRSPYSLETLHVILLLIQRNPTKVFYIRGEQEGHDHWHNFTLKQELIIRAYQLAPNEPIPLGSLVSNFFNTLPLSLYLSIENIPSSVISISNFKREEIDIDIHFLGNLFLNTPKNTTVYHDINNKLPTVGGIPDVRAIIESEVWQEGMRTNEGLSLLDQDQGGTTWAVFSSPLSIHRELFNFNYDAFAILELATPLSRSTITLYHQDANKLTGFVSTRTFNLLTGALQGTKAFNMPTIKEFFIGSSMSLEQGVPLMGRHTKLGMLTRINQENVEGGVHDYQLRVIVNNDNYTPFIARSNIRKFVDDLKIWLILSPVGSPTLDSYLDYVQQHKVLVLFPITGGPSFRNAHLTNIINMRASYPDEVKSLIEHMISEYNIRKFAFFYQDDAYGQGPLAAAHTILKGKGITNWIDVPYTRGATDFELQAKIIKETQPDAIGFFATAYAAKSLIMTMGIETIVNKQLFGISFLATVAFRQFIKQYNIPVILGAVVPNPKTSQLEIVNEYRIAMNKNNRYHYDVFSLEAYIATSLLIDTLKKIAPPFTQEKIIRHLEGIKQYDFKGIKLNFNPSQRSLAQEVWIETTEDQEWVYKKIQK